MGSRRSLETLLKLVREDEELGLPAAAAVARRQEAREAPGLLAALRFRDAAFRSEAVAPIAGRCLQEKAWIPALLELALRDPSPAVSETAIAGLPGTGSRAVPLLSEALRDRGLGVIEAKDSLEPLEKLKGGSTEPIRKRALAALEKLAARVEEAIPGLVPFLADGEEYELRQKAIHLLASLGLPALRSLVRAFEDESTRLGAASTLQMMGPPAAAALPLLIEALEDPRYWVRKAAAEAIAGIGPPASEAVPALLSHLRDSAFYDLNLDASFSTGLISPWCAARFLITEALARIGTRSPEVIWGLICALEERDSCLCAAAAQALGELGSASPQVTSALLEILSRLEAPPGWPWSPKQSPKEAAIKALTALGMEPGLLLGRFREGLKSQDLGQRQAAVESLDKLGELAGEAIPDLIELFAKETDEHLLALSARTLGHQRVKALPALLEALSRPEPQVRRGAMSALSQMSLPDAAQAIPALFKSLEDPDVEARMRALQALEDLRSGGEVPLDRLIVLLGDQDVRIKCGAARMLGKRGEEATVGVPGLLKLLQDQDPKARRSAVEALGNIVTPREETLPFILALMRFENLELAEEINSALLKLGWLEAQAPWSQPGTGGVAPAAPTRRGASSPEDLEQTFAWLESLGFPELWPDHLIRVQDESERVGYGFLLRDDEHHFVVLGDGLKVTSYRKPGTGSGARYETLDLEREARECLESCPFPAASGKLLLKPGREGCFTGRAARAGQPRQRPGGLFPLLGLPEKRPRGPPAPSCPLRAGPGLAARRGSGRMHPARPPGR